MNTDHSSNIILKTEGLTKHYGGLHALEDANFELADGNEAVVLPLVEVNESHRGALLAGLAVLALLRAGVPASALALALLRGAGVVPPAPAEDEASGDERGDGLVHAADEIAVRALDVVVRIPRAVVELHEAHALLDELAREQALPPERIRRVLADAVAFLRARVLAREVEHVGHLHLHAEGEFVVVHASGEFVVTGMLRGVRGVELRKQVEAVFRAEVHVEEAGVEAREWRCLGTLLSSPGVFTEVIHLFLAQDLVPCEIAHEEHEVIEVHWVPLTEAWDRAVAEWRTLVTDDDATFDRSLLGHSLAASSTGQP